MVGKNQQISNFYGNKLESQRSKIETGLTSKKNDSKTHNFRNGSKLNKTSKVEIKKQTSNKSIRNNNREPESKHFIFIFHAFNFCYFFVLSFP